jgi:hypothetical protein
MRVLLTMSWINERSGKECTDTRTFEALRREDVAILILDFQMAHASTVRYTLERLAD